MSETTIIDTEDLKALFDVAVSSMDFGSGFLDTDEVNMLRRIAEAIGVDPMVATPHDFRSRYSHQFVPDRWDMERCDLCRNQKGVDCHVQ